MQIIAAQEIDRRLSFGGLVETLREAFRQGAVQPVRHHHTISRGQGTDSTLLLMPAWTDFSNNPSGFIGVKIVTVSPDNNAINKPAVMGQYLLLDGATGEPLALIDGQRLTQWRTACASALASTYLSREDSSHLLVVGAGALSTFLAQAHAAVRPINRVSIWNRTPARAAEAAAQLTALGLPAQPVSDLDAALGEADIVSAATISTEPLIFGAHLKPGVHVDLVGGFTPAMREADDVAIRRAQVYVDTLAGATREAGDIVQPLQSGLLRPENICGDLYALTRGERPGRQRTEDITLFKSVGAAIEDLAAGIAVYQAG